MKKSILKQPQPSRSVASTEHVKRELLCTSPFKMFIGSLLATVAVVVLVFQGSSISKNESEILRRGLTSSKFNFREKTDINKNALKAPKIAWLMSFPGSGTTFTLDTVSQVTNTAIAKNTAPPHKEDLIDSYGYSIPVHDKAYPNGPFLYNTKKLPDSYILTKTHCSYDIISSPYQFRLQCTAGRRTYPVSDKYRKPIEACKERCQEQVHYDIGVVKKIVHLIRNPFHNVIARFNNEHKRDIEQSKWLHDHPGEYFNAFHSWCQKRDKMITKDDIHYIGFEFPENVPCHSEFFKYVQWHNNAFKLALDLEIPTLVTHYEDYDHDMNVAIKNITQFLDLSIVEKPPSFSSHEYKFMFSEKQTKNIMNFILSLASKDTKANLDRYFYFNAWPKIIWLMSFPASGTTYTLDVVKQLSNKTVARNRGKRENYSEPVHPTYISGPFLDYPDRTKPVPEKYILTKTHCHHSKSLVSSYHLFLKDCQSGNKYYPMNDMSKTPGSLGCRENWCAEDVMYDVSIVKKIVHMIRNPFDNVVARFNNPQKRNATHMKWLHENPEEYKNQFQEWCKEKDGNVTMKDVEFFGQDFPPSVPCHSEFFRYFHWHNNAFTVRRELNLTTHVQYYEDYKDTNKTLQYLMDFLELEVVGIPIDFSPHSYNFMFSSKQRKAIENWAKIVASKQTWEHIKHYFWS